MHEHDGHDVKQFDGGYETRFWCKSCRVGWSDMRMNEYEREVRAEENDDA